MVHTESELGPHPDKVIADVLAATVVRETYSADEVTDLVLDIQQAYNRWCFDEGTEDGGTGSA